MVKTNVTACEACIDARLTYRVSCVPEGPLAPGGLLDGLFSPGGNTAGMGMAPGMEMTPGVGVPGLPGAGGMGGLNDFMRMFTRNPFLFFLMMHDGTF